MTRTEMRLVILTAVGVLALLVSGATRGTVRVQAVEPCPAPDTCTLALGPGHWIVLTPKGQTLDTQEIEDETRYRLETPRQFSKGQP